MPLTQENFEQLEDDFIKERQNIRQKMLKFSRAINQGKPLDDDLRDEISNYISRTQGVKYDSNSEVIVTVGGSEAIDIGLRAVINNGDEVIIPQPSYVSYEPCAILAGAKPVTIALKAENEFRLTPEELEAEKG